MQALRPKLMHSLWAGRLTAPVPPALLACRWRS